MVNARNEAWSLPFPNPDDDSLLGSITELSGVAAGQSVLRLYASAVTRRSQRVLGVRCMNTDAAPSCLSSKPHVAWLVRFMYNGRPVMRSVRRAQRLVQRSSGLSDRRIDCATRISHEASCGAGPCRYAIHTGAVLRRE